MASRPFQFCKGERSQIKKSAAKHFEGLAALSARSAGRRAAVKAGYKTVHFSLDGCPLSCYFSGSVATASGHFVHKSERRTRDGAFIYLPPFSETSPIFCSFSFTKSQPVFLPEQAGRKKHRTPFPPPATPAGITHYTLQAKSCAKWGQAPFGNPHKKRRYSTPPRGAYRLFLLSSPPAVSVEQKSAWDWCGIFNYVKLHSPIWILLYSIRRSYRQVHSVCTPC